MALIDDYRKAFGDRAGGMSDYDIADAVASMSGIAPEIAYYKLGLEQKTDPGFVSGVAQGLGTNVLGAGQVLEDLGWKDNPVTQYGRNVVARNPTPDIQDWEHFKESPWQGVKQFGGVAVGSFAPGAVAGLAGGVAGRAMAARAALGEASGLGLRATAALNSLPAQTAIAGLPATYQIAQEQANSPLSDNGGPKDLLARYLGGAAVGLVETKFGPQRLLGLGQGAKGFTTAPLAELASEFAASPGKTFAKAWGRSTLEEAGEEAVQQPIQQLAAYQDPTTEAALKDTGWNAFGGGVGGAVLGPLGGARMQMLHSNALEFVKKNLPAFEANAAQQLQAAELKAGMMAREVGVEQAQAWLGQAQEAIGLARQDFIDQTYKHAVAQALTVQPNGQPFDVLTGMSGMRGLDMETLQAMGQQSGVSTGMMGEVYDQRGAYEANRQAQIDALINQPNVGARHSAELPMSETPNPDAQVALPGQATPNPNAHLIVQLQNKVASGAQLTPYEKLIVQRGNMVPGPQIALPGEQNAVQVQSPAASGNKQKTALQQLAAAAEAARPNHPSSPVQATLDGTFGGSGTLTIDSDGNVVLQRVAGSVEDLTKQGNSKATLQDLLDQSMYHGGGLRTDAISTSGNSAFTAGYALSRFGASRIVGTFKIPLSSLLDMVNRGEATIGNVGEGEVVLSGTAAAKYLSEVNGKPVQTEPKGLVNAAGQSLRAGQPAQNQSRAKGVGVSAQAAGSQAVQAAQSEAPAAGVSGRVRQAPSGKTLTPAVAATVNKNQSGQDELTEHAKELKAELEAESAYPQTTPEEVTDKTLYAAKAKAQVKGKWVEPAFSRHEAPKAKSLLSGLVTLLERPRPTDNPTGKGGVNIQHVNTEFDGGNGTPISELFSTIAQLTEERDRLVQAATTDRYRYYDKQGKARQKRDVTLAEASAKDQRDAVEGHTPYEESMRRLGEVNEALSDYVGELESRLGYGNRAVGNATLQAVQKSSKAISATRSREVLSSNDKATGQTRAAARFSMFYNDYNAGRITKETPMGAGVSSSRVREERVVQAKMEKAGLTDKLEDIANNGFEPYGKPLGKNGKPAPVISLLNYFFSRATLPWQRRIAQDLRRALLSGKLTMPEVVFSKEQTDGKGHSAVIEFRGDTLKGGNGTVKITIYRKGQTAQTVLHEVVHAVLASYIDAQAEEAPADQSAAYKDLLLLRDEVLKGLAKNAETKVLADTLRALKTDADQINEIVAYVMTDTSAQQVLSKIKVSAKTAGKLNLTNAWNMMLHLIKRIFGFSTSDTLLEHVIRSTGELVKEAQSETDSINKDSSLNATVIRVEDQSGRRQTAIRNPTREHAEGLVDKYGNDARAFMDQKGNIVYVFSPELLHKDVADAEGMTYHKAEGKGRSYYTDYDGNRLDQIYLERRGNDNALHYWYAAETRRMPVEQGKFAGDVQEGEGRQLFATAPATLDDVDAVSAEDMTRYARRASMWAMPFEAMGYTQYANTLAEKAEGAKQRFVEYFPQGGALASLFDHAFSLPTKLADTLNIVERSSNAPIAFANMLATYVTRQSPEKIKQLMGALDAYDPKRADSLAAAKKEFGLSEHEVSLVEQYRNALDKAVKEYATLLRARTIEGTPESRVKAELLARRMLDAKPSELMFHVFSDKDIRSAGFNAAMKEDFAGRVEPISVEPENVMAPFDLDDVANVKGGFYPIIDKTLPAEPKIVGFVHEDLKDSYQARASEELSQDKRWFFDGGSNGNNLKFVANALTMKQALESRKPKKLATDLLNTIDLMDKVLSSNRMTDAIAKGAFTAEGKPLIYDSHEALIAARPEVADRPRLTAPELASKNTKINMLMRRSDMWVEIPNTPHYGALAGKVLNGSVWGAVQDMHHTGKVINSPIYNSVLRWFKKYKTAYSLGTHIVNVGSNLSWMYLHDIPSRAVLDAGGIYYTAHVNPEKLTAEQRRIWNAFAASGALLADYSSAEIKQVLSDSMLEALKTGTSEDRGTLWGDMKATLVYEKAKAAATSSIVQKATDKAKAIDETATALYSAEDNVFRLAAFMAEVGATQLREGRTQLSNEELGRAAKFSAEAFLDYNIHARAINALKQTVLPFISWPYRALPAFAKIAATKPWKVGALIGAYALLEAMLKEMSGGDDEDKRKRKHLSPYMNDRLFGIGPHMYLQIPGLGDAQHPVYFKFGAFIPHGDLLQADNKNGFMGLKWYPQQFTPNGPLISMLAGTVLNRDPFTGKDISLGTDSQWEAFVKRATYLEGQIAPPWADAKRAGEVLDKLVADKKGPFGAETNNFIEVAKQAGLRLQQVDLAAGARAQAATVKGIEADYNKAEAKVKREAAQFPAGPDRQKALERVKELEARKKEAIKNARNEGD